MQHTFILWKETTLPASAAAEIFLCLKNEEVYVYMQQINFAFTCTCRRYREILSQWPVEIDASVMISSTNDSAAPIWFEIWGFVVRIKKISIFQAISHKILIFPCI